MAAGVERDFGRLKIWLKQLYDNKALQLRDMHLRLLGTFVMAVARHWGSLVTGGIVIGVLGIWQNTGHSINSGVYWGVAIVGLFIAFYKAWLDEHIAKESLLHASHGNTSDWIQLSAEKRRLQDELDPLQAKIPFLNLLSVGKFNLGLDESDLMRAKIERLKRAIAEIDERMKGLQG